jgi:hypothetical protein
MIVDAADKNQGVLHRHMMGRFQRSLSDLELKELYLNGRRFTWSNERQHPTLERLDRVFSTIDWEEQFPGALLTATSSGPSDHCPLILSLAPVFFEGVDFSSNLSGRKWTASWTWSKRRGQHNHGSHALSRGWTKN